MPIVFFLTYKQFQMVDLIMLNTKAAMSLARIASDSTAVARAQSLRPPEFNLSAKSSLHRPQALLSGMKTEKPM